MSEGEVIGSNHYFSLFRISAKRISKNSFRFGKFVVMKKIIFLLLQFSNEYIKKNPYSFFQDIVTYLGNW